MNDKLLNLLVKDLPYVQSLRDKSKAYKREAKDLRKEVKRWKERHDALLRILHDYPGIAQPTMAYNRDRVKVECVDLTGCDSVDISLDPRGPYEVPVSAAELSADALGLMKPVPSMVIVEKQAGDASELEEGEVDEVHYNKYQCNECKYITTLDDPDCRRCKKDASMLAMTDNVEKVEESAEEEEEVEENAEEEEEVE